MAPTRLARDGPAPRQTASRLPLGLRFPILLALNFFINSTLWTIAVNFLGPELGDVTKVEDDGLLVFAHLVYRIGVLYFTWKANYDWVEVAALTTLTSTPYAYLLSTYYEISVYTVATFMNIEVISIAFPAMLLRPTSPLHNQKVPLRNRFLLDSFQVQTAAAMLSVGVYVVVLWIALKTGALNLFLISHFDLPTLESAHNENAVSLVAKLLTTGIAARTFLLNPSISAQSASGSATPAQPFDPTTATLPETLKHNFWFWDKRTRTLIRQTAVLLAFLSANTVQRTLTLKGSDLVGAVGYSGAWILATVITAGWWIWVGDTGA